MTEFLFWFCGFIVVYNYFLYPAIVICWSKRADENKFGQLQSYSTDENLPKVSLIIAAYNEEQVIEKKIKNSLALDYPEDRFEIIIVSDGSDDETHNIAKSFKDEGVVAIHSPPREGKSSALNRGVAQASGDIIVFSDANNDFSSSAIFELIKFFKDDSIGGVCGLKHIYDSSDRESSEGDSLYWRYESAIKMAESKLGSITTADGEIFAVRKALYSPIGKDVINDDAEITFSLIKNNFRVIYEPKAVSSELASIDVVDDYHVKVRMVAGGFQTIQRWKSHIFPPTSQFSWMFISHKILRWVVPEMLLLCLICNLFLLDSFFYQLLFGLQVTFYTLAAYGWKIRSKVVMPFYIYIPFYFVVIRE